MSFLWLGAGHLYARRTGAGVAFMVTNFFLVPFFLFLPLIGWLIAPVIWVHLFVVAAVTASGGRSKHTTPAGASRVSRRAPPQIFGSDDGRVCLASRDDRGDMSVSARRVRIAGPFSHLGSSR